MLRLYVCAISVFISDVLFSGVSYNQRQTNRGGYIGVSNSRGNDNVSVPSRDNEVWSGSWEQLNAVVDNAKASCDSGRGNRSGKIVTTLVPATLNEMKKITSTNNRDGWMHSSWKSHKTKDNKWLESVWDVFKGSIVKYKNAKGDIVIYDSKTGRIVSDERFDMRVLWNGQTIKLSQLINGIDLPAGRPNEITDELILEFVSCKIRDIDFGRQAGNNDKKSVGITISKNVYQDVYHIVNNETVVNQNVIMNQSVNFAVQQTNVRLTQLEVKSLSVAIANAWAAMSVVQIAQSAVQNIVNVQIENNVFKTTPKEPVTVDLTQFNGNVQEIIAALESIYSCLEEMISLKDATYGSKDNIKISDIAGLIARGNAIEREKRGKADEILSKYIKRCEVLNERILVLESEFQKLPIENISVKEMNLIRKKVCRPILPYFRKILNLGESAGGEVSASVKGAFSAIEKFFADDDAVLEYQK